MEAFKEQNITTAIREKKPPETSPPRTTPPKETFAKKKKKEESKEPVEISEDSVNESEAEEENEAELRKHINKLVDGRYVIDVVLMYQPIFSVFHCHPTKDLLDCFNTDKHHLETPLLIVDWVETTSRKGKVDWDTLKEFLWEGSERTPVIAIIFDCLDHWKDAIESLPKDLHEVGWRFCTWTNPNKSTFKWAADRKNTDLLIKLPHASNGFFVAFICRKTDKVSKAMMQMYLHI